MALKVSIFVLVEVEDWQDQDDSPTPVKRKVYAIGEPDAIVKMDLPGATKTMLHAAVLEMTETIESTHDHQNPGN